MRRLFIGIALSTEIRTTLQELAHKMDIPGRLTPANNMHITMKFLGNCDENIVAEVVDILGHVIPGHEPFKIKIQGFEAFPSIRRPRVAWFGVNNGSKSLVDLSKEVDYGLKELFEPSKFTPHITIARYKKPENLKKLSSEYCNIEIGEMTAEKLTLFQSELSPEGARYSAYKEFPLISS